MKGRPSPLQTVMMTLCSTGRSVPTSHGRPLGPGTKVPLIGLLEAVAISVVAAGVVVLTGLCTPLCRRLYRPAGIRQQNADRDSQRDCNQKQSAACVLSFRP